MEEHLQTPALHPDGGQPLDPVRGFYVGDALRQEQRGPRLGAHAGTRRLAGGVNGVAVQREPRLCGEDGSDVPHVLGDDRERLSRGTNGCGGWRGCQCAGKQRTGAQSCRSNYGSGRLRRRQRALMSRPYRHVHVLSSGCRYYGLDPREDWIGRQSSSPVGDERSDMRALHHAVLAALDGRDTAIRPIRWTTAPACPAFAGEDHATGRQHGAAPPRPLRPLRPLRVRPGPRSTSARELQPQRQSCDLSARAAASLPTCRGSRCPGPPRPRSTTPPRPGRGRRAATTGTGCPMSATASCRLSGTRHAAGS
jgi:hypothetical protein